MRNMISVSTGCFHKIIENRDENWIINKLSKFQIDGIELTFPSHKEMMKFRLTRKNKEFLHSLTYNSLHAPWSDIFYSDKETITIDRIYQISQLVNAKILVVHPNTVNNYSIFKKSSPKIGVENMGSKWKYGNKISEITEILSKNPNLYLTLDIAHLVANNQDIKKVIQKFKNKIVEIHTSIHRDIPHSFLHPDKKEILEEIKHSNSPIVIEGTILKDISELKNEIKFIISFLQD